MLLAVYGRLDEGQPKRLGVFRSADNGVTWELLSIVRADYELREPSIAQLPDGRLVMIARPEGAIMWSSDGGRSWTEPLKTSILGYPAHMIRLPDDRILLVYGVRVPPFGARARVSVDQGASRSDEIVL